MKRSLLNLSRHKRFLTKKELEWIDKNLSKVKVIYTDMDGTLVGPDGSLFTSPYGKLTFLVARAIFETLKAGVDVVIVSGRSQYQLKENARLLGFKNYIAELGCEIVYNLGEKVIYNIGNIKLEEGKKPIDIIKGMGAVKLLFSEFSGKIRYYTPWSEYHDVNILLVGNIDVEKANKILKENKLSCLRISDNGKVPPEPDFSCPHCYHLMPRFSGKGSAVRKDKKIRGLHREEIVGIGESIGDIEIAPEVGAYFVVKNGVENEPRIKDIAENSDNIFILDEAMGLGWAKVIDILLNLKKIKW